MARAKSQFLGVQYPQGLDIVVKQPQQVIFGKELYPIYLDQSGIYHLDNEEIMLTLAVWLEAHRED